MKLGKRTKSPIDGLSAKPAKNQSKRNLLIILVVAITAVLILWVYSMGKKAEETVTVIMLNQAVYKNQAITESMLTPYEMLTGEFEKYAVTQQNGTKKRRILLWDERDMIIGTFAAYPLQASTLAEYTDFIISRTDNSDSVLYSYPGKNLVPLEVGSSELQAFKTFLQPGDRINIVAIYSESDKVYVDDGYGGTESQEVEVFRSEVVFQDIVLADLLNSSGDSILDIYASYNDMTTYQQAQLDASTSFQESVEPKTMLVALTPEEETRYYYYLGKDNIEFKISLPQRVE